MRRSLIILFLCNAFIAQVRSQEQAAQTMSSVNLNNAQTFDHRYQGVKGSPFILEEWNRGILYPSGAQPMEVGHINFDRYTSKLCFRKEPEGETYLINKYMIDSFRVIHASDTLCFIRSRTPGSTDFIFLQRMYSGKVKLFMDHGKQFIKADYEQVYSADRRYDEFRDEPAFYLSFGEAGELLEVQKNKKQTAALFGDQSSRIMKFIKDEGIRLTDPADLVMLAAYADSLRP
jgi:hypothetical protein